MPDDQRPESDPWQPKPEQEGGQGWQQQPPVPPSGGSPEQGWQQPQAQQPPPYEGYGSGQQYGQPGQAQYGQPAGPPPNYLVWAILSTIFCCLPLGVASIVFAARVNDKYHQGDVAGAQEASRKAKKFAIASAVVGLVLVALYLVVMVAVGRNGASS